MKCVHCFLPHESDGCEELSYLEIRRILDEIVDEGCIGITLTGGEPLIRKDFLIIYDYAYKKGLVVVLFTNGTLLTPEIADRLQMFPPYRVEISLYGMTKSTYEKVTRIAGTYEKCINGIELLLDRGIKTQFENTCSHC
jgi:MoaA/NifB/PqqE/SkfB family radical SAM enzyme